MPRSRSSHGGRWQLTAAALLAPFLGTGCTLVQPGCRNRDVKTAIEHEARESVELWMSTSGLPAPPADTPVSLADQVEVGRQDNTHSCTANVVVGSGNDAVIVPIEYEVIVGDGGQPFYRWDNDGFGKKLIGTAWVSILKNMAHPQTNSGPADDPSPKPKAPPTPLMEAWEHDVSEAIHMRAEQLTDMPAGSQRVRFRIGPDGEITMASAVEPIENAQLAEKLVSFLDATKPVAKPPLGKATWVEVVINF